MRLYTFAIAISLSGCIPVLLPIPVVAPAASGPAIPLSATPAAEPQFNEMLAAFRADNNLPPLTPHAPLDTVAASHAADMLARDYLSHRSPEGVVPDTRVRAAQIKTCGTSEVLAAGYDTATKAFGGWLASPGHKAALADASMRSYGIGHAGDKWSVVMVRACPES